MAKASVQMIGQGDRDYEDEEVIDESAGVDGEDTSEPTSKSATSKPRRPVRRKVVEIELDNDTSLSSYVGQFPPKTELEKYLVAVAFLCEHRKEVEGVSANHVYTCFLKLKWPTGSKDFSQPLRNLKSDNLLDSGKTRGTFVVNHIGRDRVLKLAEA